MLKNVIFISGIDTSIGKSVITGYLAKWLKENTDLSIITVKLAQTGNDKVSEDIELHRSICNEELSDDDINGKTCPYIFKYPASPHLSASLENIEIKKENLLECLQQNSKKYDLVLCEGVGGLMVPLCNTYTTIDFIKEYNLPLVLVTSGKLGSINHTLLSLEALKNRNIDLKALIYNYFPTPTKENMLIYNDATKVFKRFLKKYDFNAELISFENNSFPKKTIQSFFNNFI